MSDEALVLSLDEVARALGVSFSIAYRLVRAGDIPSIRIGRRVLISRKAVEQFLATREAESTQVSGYVAR